MWSKRFRFMSMHTLIEGVCKVFGKHLIFIVERGLRAPPSLNLPRIAGHQINGMNHGACYTRMLL